MIWTDSPAPADLAAGFVPMQQHRSHGAACRALGAGVRALALGDPRRPLATAQVLVRRWPLLGRVALLSRGPVWGDALDPDDRRAALSALLARLGAEHRAVLVTPDPVAGADPLAGAGWLPMVTAATLARLDLTGGAAALRGRLHGKWRNRLVRAEAAGLTLTEGAMPPDPGHWLLREEAAQARARAYRALPAAFTLAWLRAGGPRAARLFAAHRDGRPVAGMLFLLHPPGATYHLGWSGAEGRASDAHTLLMWRAALWLARKGYPAVDLGPLDTETAPGLARFKLGTGARPLTLGATRLAAPGTRAVALLAEGRRRAA